MDKVKLVAGRGKAKDGGGAEDKISTAEDIEKFIGRVGGVKEKLQTGRTSSHTSNKCKTIGSYIGKLNEDIKILMAVKEALSDISKKLDQEKLDTFLLEHISKDALVVFNEMKEDGSYHTEHTDVNF